MPQVHNAGHQVLLIEVADSHQAHNGLGVFLYWGVKLQKQQPRILATEPQDQTTKQRVKAGGRVVVVLI